MTDSSDSAFVLPSNQGCVSIVDGIPNSYGYVPSMAAGIVFLVLFGLSMVIHVGQTIYTRTWFNIVFAIGALVEVLGWAGRTWSAECPYNSEAFLMQISTLIIAPTFFHGWYLLCSWAVYLSARERVQPNFSQEIPLHFLLLRLHIPCHTSCRWCIGIKCIKHTRWRHCSRHTYNGGGHCLSNGNNYRLCLLLYCIFMEMPGSCLS